MSRVLSKAREAANTRYRLAAQGIEVVRGRAMICYWAVRELGVSMTDVARYLKIAVPTVSAGVKKREQIVNKEGLVLTKILNMKV